MLKKTLRFNIKKNYFSKSKLTEDILKELEMNSKKKEQILEDNKNIYFKNLNKESNFIQNSKDAFINNYKNIMNDSEEQLDKTKINNYKDRYDKEFSDFFEFSDNDQEKIKKSKKMIDSIRLNKYFYPDREKVDVKNEYDRFDIYNENYMIKKNNKIFSNEYEKHDSRKYYGKSLLKFIKNLDPEIVSSHNFISSREKEDSNSIQNLKIENNENKLINQNITFKGDEEELKSREELNLEKDDDFEEYDFDYMEEEIDKFDNKMEYFNRDGDLSFFEETQEMIPDGENEGRLSPNSRLEIYKMFLEGWKVRDISLKFGILPYRAKAIIWQQNYYFEECLPYLDPETIRLGVEREYLSNMFDTFVDYGIDLEEYEQHTEGVVTSKWNNKLINEFPEDNKFFKGKTYDQNEFNSYLEYINSLKSKVFDVTTKEFIGKPHNGYYIREIIGYKGKRKLQLKDKFKKAIQRSHHKIKLDKKSQNLLDKAKFN